MVGPALFPVQYTPPANGYLDLAAHLFQRRRLTSSLTPVCDARMLNLKIVQAGHPVLRHKARTLTSAEIKGAEIRQLIDLMRETMRDAGRG